MVVTSQLCNLIKGLCSCEFLMLSNSLVTLSPEALAYTDYLSTGRSTPTVMSYLSGHFPFVVTTIPADKTFKSILTQQALDELC